MAALAVLLLGLTLLSGRIPTPAYAATNAAVVVDGTSSGRTFDGIGAISGGGGNARLLYDYPATQRSQILDYLFKPGYGADLQILKVEVGGDTNSTDGAEASIEHTKGTVDCDSGYEWWLMEQAQARNPNIKFYALSWGAPGWIGNGTFYSQDMIDYLMSWLGCAKQHGLAISYIGGWNERTFDASWYESLKSAMTSNGYTSTQLVGGDEANWDIATSMKSDTNLYNAVDIAGAHYPCVFPAMTSCSSTSDAQTLGKPIWASESGSENAENGAAPVARALNRGYIDAKMTAYINWPIIASLYQNLYFHDQGLITATQPWSGAYSVGRTAWTIAQTTQFTSPGWKYLDTATGYLGGNRGNGSYVSYAAPDKSAWSTVFETMDATASQTITLSVAGGLPGGTLHVWSTDLSAPGTATPHMVQNADLTASGGAYTLTLAPGHIYTVTTTTTGQGAGSTTSPQRTQLALPYSDNFAGYSAGQEAKYLSSMNGAFQAASCGGGRTGECLRQMAPVQPIRWTAEHSDLPYTLMGDLGWSNYTVSSDILLEQSGSAAEIIGRAGSQGKFNGGLNAYHLRLSDTGAWSLLKTSGSWTWTTLAGGTVTAPGTNTWHNLSLSFQGTAITAKIDGSAVGTVTDSSYGGGQVGLGTAGYYPVQYSHLSITPGTVPDLSGTYKIVSVSSGKVLDAVGRGTGDGTLIDQWTDNGGTNQQWTLALNSAGYYTITGVGSGKALDIPFFSTWPGTQLQLWTPNGGANQQWVIAPSDNGSYTIESRSDGYMADVLKNSTTDGAAIDEWPTSGSTNQQWTLVKVP